MTPTSCNGRSTTRAARKRAPGDFVLLGETGPEAVLFAGIGSCLIYAAQIIKQICSSASFRVGFKNAMKRP